MRTPPTTVPPADVHALLDEIGAHIAAYDREWRYVYVNESAQRILGKRADELLGRSIWELFPGAVGNQYYQELHAALNEQRVIISEHHYAPFAKWFRNYIYPSPRGVTVFSADITAEKQARRALADTEQQLHLAMRAGRMGTWQWTFATGRFECSPALEAMLGLPPGEFGATFDQFLRCVEPDDRARLSPQVFAALDRRGEQALEFRIRRPDGTTRWIDTRGAVFRDEGGEPQRAMGVCIDVTERKQAEGQRDEFLRREKAARQELEKANQAKDQFLAVLSHELRTPLTPVLTAAQMLEADSSLPKRHRDVITLIRRNTELEARLVDDLLDLTRISRGKLDLFRTPVDLHDKISHVASMCEAEARAAGVEVTVALGAARRMVSADAARMQQVLWNLLKNAIKYTPAGGRVEVQTANPDNDHLQVRIRDTGRGLTPQEIDTIFEAFVQGDRPDAPRSGGLGLGLAISRSIVALHDGSLVAESAGPGRGATFMLTLETIIAAPSPAPSAGSRLERGEGYILLVEDHADTRQVLAALLRGTGYRVCVADTVASALRIIEAQPVDLMVCDVGLPDGTGLDLMRQIRARRPLKAIALSGYGMERDMAESHAAGFQDHLTKPVNVERLRAAIRRQLATPASRPVPDASG